MATHQWLNADAFKGRTAIVTGGAGSFGRLLCHALAKAGANVVVNDLGSTYTGEGFSVQPAETLVQELRDLGYSAKADTHSVLEADKIVNTALTAFGRVDILINNAGITKYARLEDQSPEDIRRTLEVNTLGPLLLCRTVWPLFLAQKYGRIINMSSASVMGMLDFVPYITSKAALIGLTKALAQEAGFLDIKVNVVAPISASRMTDAGSSGVDRQSFAENYPPEGNIAIILALALESCDFQGEFFNTGSHRVNRVVLGTVPGIRDAYSAEKVLEQKEKLLSSGSPITEQASAYSLLGWTASDNQLA